MTQIITTIASEMGLDFSAIKLYESSITKIQDAELMMLKITGEKKIAVIGSGDSFSEFQGDLLTERIKLCPLTHQNRLVLNKHLSYTLPSAFGRDVATFGAGDRLGLASPGLIRIISKSSAKPILAQQSKRELDLTGRTYSNVLDDVAFAVFQEGYKGGYGADGDHLKNETDVAEALSCGYTMITLDCSGKIGRGIEAMSDQDALSNYNCYPIELRKSLESKFLDKVFLFGDNEITFTNKDLIQCVLIYYEAICFIDQIYKDHIVKAPHQVDFEISIDETESVTTAAAHLFVATQIKERGIEITSLAPRFTGEFQKGIDYIGDLASFEQQFRLHAVLADYFGYKLSIHSGSDKFRVFSIIGKHTSGRLHVKTSGTNWLEAVFVFAECDPTLYREIHHVALQHFDEARAFYHVSADTSKIADPNDLPDNRLLEYFGSNDARQLLHITYGFILRDAALRKKIYSTLGCCEDIYYHRLEQHIGRHLLMTGLLKYNDMGGSR